MNSIKIRNHTIQFPSAVCTFKSLFSNVFYCYVNHLHLLLFSSCTPFFICFGNLQLFKAFGLGKSYVRGWSMNTAYYFAEWRAAGVPSITNDFEPRAMDSLRVRVRNNDFMEYTVCLVYQRVSVHVLNSRLRKCPYITVAKNIRISKLLHEKVKFKPITLTLSFSKGKLALIEKISVLSKTQYILVSRAC